MKRVDVLIVIALVVAAAGSAIGLATYHEKVRYDVAYETATTTLEAGPDTGTSVRFEIPVTQVNLTTVIVTVTASGGGLRAQSVPVQVTVTPPGLPAQTMEGSLAAGASSIDLPVEFALQDVPTGYRALVHEESEALADVLPASRLGTGMWVVEVTFGASTLPVPDSFAARAELAATSYAAVASPYIPEAA